MGDPPVKADSGACERRRIKRQAVARCYPMSPDRAETPIGGSVGARR
jgi:hypothetical protein